MTNITPPTRLNKITDYTLTAIKEASNNGNNSIIIQPNDLFNAPEEEVKQLTTHLENEGFEVNFDFDIGSEAPKGQWYVSFIVKW